MPILVVPRTQLLIANLIKPVTEIEQREQRRETDYAMALPHGAHDEAPHAMFPADTDMRRAAEAAITGRVVREPAWKRAVAVLKALAGKEGLLPDVEAPQPAPVREQSAADTMAAGDFLPASVEDIEEHLAKSAGAVHPRGAAGYDEAPASLRAAVAKIDNWREKTPAKRAGRLEKLQSLSSSLQPLTDELYDTFAPRHI
jgi:hypothetical protein